MSEEAIFQAPDSTPKAPAAETQHRKPKMPKGYNPDRFINLAKHHAIQNYNDHRSKGTRAPITLETVHIVQFTMVDDNWTAIIASEVARNLLWLVSYDAGRDETLLSAYKLLDTIKIEKRI